MASDGGVSLSARQADRIRVYGYADGPIERVGMVGPGTFLRITPTTSWSWNMEGVPAGDTWYEARRAVHDHPARERS